MSVAALHNFPILAPLAFDAAGAARPAPAQPGSGARNRNEAAQEHDSRHSRPQHESFDRFARRPNPPPRAGRVPSVAQAQNSELLEALIGQMGGGVVPSGKGIYIDLRV